MGSTGIGTILADSPAVPNETDAPDPIAVQAQLTGPGGPFEVVVEEVGGRPTEVYKERMRSLREIPPIAQLRGDEQPFIVQGDRRIGFDTFVRTANSLSAGFTKLGVGHGDRVAVLAQNRPEWCLSFWATVDLGAVLVGLNGWWKADEIVYGLQDSGAKVLVADRKRLERVTGDLDECPDLEHVLLIDCDPVDLGLEGDDRVRRFDELTDDVDAELPSTPIDEDDPAVILYTSGTTGRPKGAVSTHRNMIANMQNTFFGSVFGSMVGADATIPTEGQPAALFTSPLFHVSGLHSGLVVGMLAGMRMVLVDGRFEPLKALELIQDEQISVWATVPTMVWRVCEHPARHDYDTSSVRTVAFGGSPSADELQRMVRDTFPNVKGGSNAYGLTETSSVATVLSAHESLERPDSVGRPVPTVRIRIADELGNEVPPGHTGEVLITGPTLMAGYWGKPEATAEAIRDGWLHTGDIGRLDEQGYLYITDRKKDMIIRGGENIYCVEIENRLVLHPEVPDAAVIGVPHPELGEEVKAVVQVAKGSSLGEDDVKAWVAEALAGFKVPAYVELRTDKLPRNASGKLLKNALRGVGEVSFEETM
jgi:long-chain acyl-CoA synthetase